MRRRLSGIVFGTAVALACAGGGPGESPTGTPTGNPPSPVPPPPTAQPPAPPPSDNRVQPPLGSVANFDIVDDSFVDADGNHDQEGTATVAPTQLVTWTQNGNHLHRVEFSKVPDGAKSPDSEDIRPGQTWQFRPSVAGVYIFFCRYHEYMMDVTITVEAP